MDDQETRDRDWDRERSSTTIDEDVVEREGEDDEELDRAPQPGNTPAPDEDAVWPR